MHQIDIFYFLKKLFLNQHIKTIQNITKKLNFLKIEVDLHFQTGYKSSISISFFKKYDISSYFL